MAPATCEETFNFTCDAKTISIPVSFLRLGTRLFRFATAASAI